MTLIPYFAYGSNMLLQRLQGRCKSARFHSLASVPGYKVVFSKRSTDGSGKATLVKTTADNARVYGVVFHLSEEEFDTLDDFEGVGNGYYRQDDFRVEVGSDAKLLTVSTYFGMDGYLDPKLQPYDWYLGLVIAGAEQNGLPENYVAALRANPSRIDPNPKRPSRLEAQRVLASLNQKKTQK
jgi:gamma-glutamylcyclotransferase